MKRIILSFALATAMVSNLSAQCAQSSSHASVDSQTAVVSTSTNGATLAQTSIDSSSLVCQNAPRKDHNDTTAKVSADHSKVTANDASRSHEGATDKQNQDDENLKGYMMYKQQVMRQ